MTLDYLAFAYSKTRVGTCFITNTPEISILFHAPLFARQGRWKTFKITENFDRTLKSGIRIEDLVCPQLVLQGHNLQSSTSIVILKILENPYRRLGGFTSFMNDKPMPNRHDSHSSFIV